MVEEMRETEEYVDPEGQEVMNFHSTLPTTACFVAFSVILMLELFKIPLRFLDP